MPGSAKYLNTFDKKVLGLKCKNPLNKIFRAKPQRLNHVLAIVNLPYFPSVHKLVITPVFMEQFVVLIIFLSTNQV